jgi:hypothetical protein
VSSVQALEALSTERKRLVVTARLRSPAGEARAVEALVDSGAEVNCISPRLATELRWQLDKMPPRTIKAFDGNELLSFGVYKQSILVKDSLQREKKQDCTFYAVQSSEYAMVLGYPWLEAADPLISFRTSTWRYPYEMTANEEVTAHKLLKTADKQRGPVHALLVSG